MTESVAKKLTKPGRYAADTTLYLKVSPSGAKSWVQRIMIVGKRRDIGLGGFPVVRVNDAKMQALKNRRLVNNGGDPLAKFTAEQLCNLLEILSDRHGLRSILVSRQLPAQQWHKYQRPHPCRCHPRPPGAYRLQN